jgi:hypothetical protein
MTTSWLHQLPAVGVSKYVIISPKSGQTIYKICILNLCCIFGTYRKSQSWCWLALQAPNTVQEPRKTHCHQAKKCKPTADLRTRYIEEVICTMQRQHRYGPRPSMQNTTTRNTGRIRHRQYPERLLILIHHLCPHTIQTC